MTVRRPGPLVAFLVATFSWSWALWALAAGADLPEPAAHSLLVAGRYGPSVAAIVVTVVVAGRSGLSELLVPLRSWRAPAPLWLLVVAGPTVLVLVSIGLTALLGTEPGTFNDPASAYLVLPAFLVILVAGGPLGEELGWRGFALDHLQARSGPVAASLLLGAVWGVWHLPLFLDPSQVQAALPPLLYLGQTLSTAVVYTWLWNRTRSLPLVLVLHTMTNLAAGVFPLLMPEAPNQLAFGVAVALATLAAIALVLATHGRLGLEHPDAAAAVPPPLPDAARERRSPTSLPDSWPPA
ncbi:MAG: CPBP family intramembrane glutamic endopeptidase [Nitriliruptoraceae bacterium]